MLVAIGDNCIDRYLPPIALERVGGNALNVAASWATHGYRSAYAGVVGTDAQGTRILNALQSIGVDIECVVRAPGPTGLTEIQVQGGDYKISQETYGVSDRVEVTDAMRKHLSAQATRIHLTLTGRAAALIQHIRALPVPFSVDLGIVRSAQDLEHLEHLLPYISEAFFSAGSGLDDPAVDALLQRVVSLGARPAIATRGERGCTALVGEVRVSVASRIAAVDIVDPLGAGDAFIAGYLSTLNGGGSPGAAGSAEHSLDTASTWAAQACRHIGAWAGGEQ